MIINENTVYLDSDTQIINERLYLPLRALSEGFGNQVEWNEDKRVANIISNTTTVEKSLPLDGSNPLEGLFNLTSNFKANKV